MNERMISTQTGGFEKYGTLEEILKLLKDCGFTAYDCTMCDNGKEAERFIEDDNYLENARRFRAYADSIALPCNQSHAPFPSARSGNEEYNKSVFPKLVRAIEVSGILGAKVCVVHPCNDYSPEENAEKVYLPLAPYARKAGVKIGVENMWNWNTPKNIFAPGGVFFARKFRGAHESFCLRTYLRKSRYRAAELRAMNTSAPEMVRALGGYFQSMHLHDVNFYEDSHTLPFTEKVDFEAVIAAMKEIGYRGDVTLESGNFPRKFPREIFPEAVRLMAATARYFKNRLDE